ncbi:putative NAD dependent epimerase/dehydratase [Scheffersomyces coipomensis]|uniref:putative NAD dependent epimerase/dehydratase n=1 Tax=Scheffersomyces coipomensis TaxID=1788519 RepID=UPI00315CAB8B
MAETILVTGGTGQIGAFIVIQLLEAGKYKVRTTVRNDSKSKFLVKLLKDNSSKITDEVIKNNLTIFQADLNSDEGWDKAIDGSDYVLHVASPVISVDPTDYNEVIIPARDGTLRVTKLSHKYGIKKLIFTSSFATVGFGHPSSKTIFDESDYSPLETAQGAYVKSKIEAERAFWEFINSDENKKSAKPLIASALLPVGVFGPVLKGFPVQSSIEITTRLISGEMKFGAPNIYLGVVDVRDVAKLHIEAITNEKVNGERIILIGQKEAISLLQFADYVKDIPGVNRNNLPIRNIPSFIIRFVALFLQDAKDVVPYLDVNPVANNDKAVKIFNWKPIDIKESIIENVKGVVREHS